MPDSHRSFQKGAAIDRRPASRSELSRGQQTPRSSQEWRNYCSCRRVSSGRVHSSKSPICTIPKASKCPSSILIGYIDKSIHLRHNVARFAPPHWIVPVHLFKPLVPVSTLIHVFLAIIIRGNNSSSDETQMKDHCWDVEALRGIGWEAYNLHGPRVYRIPMPSIPILTCQPTYMLAIT